MVLGKRKMDAAELDLEEANHKKRILGVLGGIDNVKNIDTTESGSHIVKSMEEHISAEVEMMTWILTDSALPTGND